MGHLTALFGLVLVWGGVLQGVVAVYTKYGVLSGDQEGEVREFTGWLHGGQGDYYMTAEEVARRKLEGSKVNKGKSGLMSEFEFSPNSINSILSLAPGITTTWDGSYPGYPKKVIGMYLPLADNTEEGFHDSSDWTPRLYPYQQRGANVLFFTFINPTTMEVPRAFAKLAATKGTDVEGAVPGDTRIIFAIGGYAYSLKPNPWEWLTSREKAEAMAEKVASWRDDYRIDGIDLDIEEGAGSNRIAGPNLVHFVRRIRSIVPDMLIGQPAYGYPQVQAESDVINASWNPGGTSNNLASSVGLMVYEGTQALNYVKNYAKGSEQWDGFPIHVDVPKSSILLGCKGATPASGIMKLAEASVRQDLLGIMVWSCSVMDGLVYGKGWDCSGSEDAMTGYVAAMEFLKQHGA
jgi:hypothetical protein